MYNKGDGTARSDATLKDLPGEQDEGYLDSLDEELNDRMIKVQDFSNISNNDRNGNSVPL